MSKADLAAELKEIGDFMDNVDGGELPPEIRQAAAYLANFRRARDIVQNHRTPAVLRVVAQPGGALDDLNLDFLDDDAGMPGPRRRDPETGRMRPRE